MVSVNGKKIVKEKYKKEKQKEIEFFDNLYNKYVDDFYRSKEEPDEQIIEDDDSFFAVGENGKYIMPLTIKDEILTNFEKSHNANVRTKKMENVELQLNIIKLFIQNTSKSAKVISAIDEKLKFTDMYKKEIALGEENKYSYAIDKVINDSYDYIITPFRYTSETIDNAIVRCGFAELIKKEREQDV